MEVRCQVPLNSLPHALNKLSYTIPAVVPQGEGRPPCGPAEAPSPTPYQASTKHSPSSYLFIKHSTHCIILAQTCSIPIKERGQGPSTGSLPLCSLSQGAPAVLSCRGSREHFAVLTVPHSPPAFQDKDVGLVLKNVSTSISPEKCRSQGSNPSVRLGDQCLNSPRLECSSQVELSQEGQGDTPSGISR